jgi:hypothetical protein
VLGPASSAKPTKSQHTITLGAVSSQKKPPVVAKARTLGAASVTPNLLAGSTVGISGLEESSPAQSVCVKGNAAGASSSSSREESEHEGGNKSRRSKLLAKRSRRRHDRFAEVIENAHLRGETLLEAESLTERTLKLYLVEYNLFKAYVASTLRSMVSDAQTDDLLVKLFEALFLAGHHCTKGHGAWQALSTSIRVSTALDLAGCQG